MTKAQKPVYLIARGDKWLTDPMEDAALAFGSVAEAEAFIDTQVHTADEKSDAFAIVEYAFSEVIDRGKKT